MPKEEKIVEESVVVPASVNHIAAIINADKERKVVELQRMVQEAQATHDRMLSDRAKAPDGVSGEFYFEKDERDRLVELHVPEAIPKFKPRKPGVDMEPGEFMQGATMKASWCPPGENDIRLKDMIRQGHIPVIVDGEHISHGGDLLFRRDIVFTRDKFKRGHDLNQARLRTDIVQAETGDEGRKFRGDGLEVSQGPIERDRSSRDDQ